MESKGFKRKLTAILSADVVGYSRLMRDDEEATVRTLNTYKEMIFDLIERNKGRLVDSTGDNLLAEFASIVDAVRCAIQIQEDLKVQNEELPDNRKMEFRIGVNLGDVIQEGDRIYGDGVNISARIESLADSGGICISRSVYDQVKRKLSLNYEYQGEHQVKNIDEPLRVYKVLVWSGQDNLLEEDSSLEPASIDRMAYPLPDKPSIAVLPFTNMSGDPSQDYIGDGLCEIIISALSVSSEIFVIARNSTFIYKEKPVKVQQVAEDLGVQYVLEGSIQRSGDRLRVTAQLIDALTGHHLWSEKYDRKMKDLFDLQDEITRKILVSLHIKLRWQAEDFRLISASTDNLEALNHFIKADELFIKTNPEDNAKAREHWGAAIKLDPKYVGALTGAAWTHYMDAILGWTDSPLISINNAFELTQRALKINDKHAHAHSLLGMIYIGQRQHDKALTEGKLAITLNPNFAIGHGLLAGMMMWSGEFNEAITLMKKTLRLNPNHSNINPIHLVFLAISYIFLGQYEEALRVCKEMEELALSGQKLPIETPLRIYSFAYQELGRESEARAYMTKLMNINPNNSLENIKTTYPFKNPVHLERMLDALRKAGMPGKESGEAQEKPSIAVLPFINMSNDPDQEYFSDGMAEDIITDLSKITGIIVIARNSSFTYKGKSVKVQQVAKDLGVQFVLEGSVRRGGNRLRITAQLIDGETGHHFWAERYDRELKDIFAVQDEITLNVVSELAVTLTADEPERLARKHTENFEAYDLWLRAARELYGLKKENLQKGKELSEKVIELDPNFAGGYAWLSLALSKGIRFGYSTSPLEDAEKAFVMAQKAVAIDDTFALSHFVLADAYLNKGLHDDAVDAAMACLRIQPGDAQSHLYLGFFQHWAGRGEEAVKAIKKAQQLDPRYLSSKWVAYLDFEGLACFTAGHYGESVEALNKAIERFGPLLPRQTFLIASYCELGKIDEASAIAKQLLRSNPNFSLSSWGYAHNYKNPEDTERLLNALRKAGLE